MIDTIQIEVVNLYKYENFLNHVDNPLVGESTNILRYDKSMLNHKLVRYHAEDNQRESRKGKIFIPSSTYEVAWYLQDNRRAVFNISIPKYLFGNNVRMCVAHKLDHDFNWNQGIDLEYNLKAAFDRLHDFVIGFNNRFLRVELADIQLMRIDFCFNRIFDNYILKEMYASLLKQKRFRYMRNEPAHYGNTIYAVGKLTTKKIYDKGLEYAKNDYNKMRVNHPQEANRLLEISARMLRYEIEYRLGWFKAYVFHELMEAPEESVYMRYLCKHWGGKAVEKELIKHYRGRPPLCFDASKINFFNRKLFYLAAQNFNDFIHEMSAVTIDTGAELRAKVLRYNEFVTHSPLKEGAKINYKGLRLFADNLVRYGKDEIRLQRLYGKTTYHRYIRLLKKVGYNQPEIVTSNSFGSNLDLVRYHELFL